MDDNVLRQLISTVIGEIKIIRFLLSLILGAILALVLMTVFK